MTFWQEIKQNLFGPSAVHIERARVAVRGLRELRRIGQDEKCIERLSQRGYLSDAQRVALYRQLLVNAKKA